ncbi:MAG TPA: cysteine dioxygenase family protein [Gaiellaceae bacterium]|nr:cysteine dioxygenase family protein [Gaiellaceae bacterium]
MVIKHVAISEWIRQYLPADRDLEKPELAELATRVGHEPSLWRRYVRHDPGKRYYTQLYRDQHLDVWLLCWLDDQKTGYHDHDLSSGGVYVCEGALVEDRFSVTAEGLCHSSRERRAGESFVFDAAYIHGMRHAGGPPVTSIHCYSPPLWRMGYYETDDQGSLTRISMTYLDEIAESA